MIAKYTKLSVFPDVEESLVKLKNVGYKLFAFSGGTKKDINALIIYNNVSEYFDGVVSTGDAEVTTPEPSAYKYFNDCTNSYRSNTRLISSNPFDIMGTSEYGFKTAWIKRNDKFILEPWFKNRNLTGKNVSEVADIIIEEDK